MQSSAGRRILKNQSGLTMVEMMVASTIALIFVMAASTGYLVNQKAYKRNNQKLELQQTAAYVMEVMERKIRGAATAKIVAGNRIQLYDNSGAQITYFRLQVISGVSNLYEQSTLLARQKLINLAYQPNADTTTVRITLQLEDENKNQLRLVGSAALRNNRKFRNLSGAF